MSGHVYRKFPDLVEAIQTLKIKNSAFGEMCADYEEMCTWLSAQCRSIDPHSEECDQAREIIQDLEDEIKMALKYAGYYTL